MADPTGWGALGNVLGGGIDREGAYLEGRYRSAQTESALSNARKAQADAIKQERTNQIIDDLMINTPDFNNPADTDLASMIVAGLGGDFSSALTGRKTGQEIRLRDQIADPTTDYATVQRNRAAVGDTPFNPIDAVGTKGAFIDTRNPDLAVQAPLGDALFPDESGDTSAIKNYRFLTGELGGAGGPDTFGRVLRSDQVINAGGVPVVRNTGTGTLTQPVSTEQVADNAGQIAGGKTTGTGMAKRQLDLPRAQAAVAATGAKWDGLSNVAKTLQANEDLWTAVGLGQPIASIPGTEGAKIRAQINTLKAKVGFAVLQDLRDNSKTGGAVGNVSNQENVYLQNALAALDANLAPEDFREQLQILIDFADGAKSRMIDAFNNTYPELSGRRPTQPGAPAAAAPAAGAPIRYVRDANGKLVRAQ